MIKTIKTTKYMRLDELIKHVWDNAIRDKSFVSNNASIVKFDCYGGIKLENDYVRKDTIFEVEVEEEITEDTVFDNLITVERDDMTYYEYKRSIGFILSKTSDVIQILASVNGKYRTVWERENQ